jgi:endonuclease III
MQAMFDFEPSPILPRLRDQLLSTFGPQAAERRLDPASQLVKALISTRTYDAVSWAAFGRLKAAFPDWRALADAEPKAVEAIIADTTFADQKARQLPILFRLIEHRTGDISLDFLADLPVDQAMAWLEELPGVGRQIAAAVLNFSTLNKRAMVVDTHVHRVARRLGLVGRSAEPAQSHEALMVMAPAAWGAEAFYELHWLIKGLGQSICTDSPPACGRCPLNAMCPRVDVGVGRKVVAFSPATGAGRRRR